MYTRLTRRVDVPHYPRGGEEHEHLDLRVGVTWGLAISIVVGTLAIWIFFYVENMPLDAGGTAVVALAMTLAAMGGRWVWSRAWRQREAKKLEVKK